MAGRFPLIAHFLGQARKYFFAPVFGLESRGWLVPTEPMVGWNSARNLIKNFISSNRFLESTACGIEIVWDRGVFRINDGIENLSLSLSLYPLFLPTKFSLNETFGFPFTRVSSLVFLTKAAVLAPVYGHGIFSHLAGRHSQGWHRIPKVSIFLCADFRTFDLLTDGR